MASVCQRTGGPLSYGGLRARGGPRLGYCPRLWSASCAPSPLWSSAGRRFAAVTRYYPCLGVSGLKDSPSVLVSTLPESWLIRADRASRLDCTSAPIPGPGFLSGCASCLGLCPGPRRLRACTGRPGRMVRMASGPCVRPPLAAAYAALASSPGPRASLSLGSVTAVEDSASQLPVVRV